LEEQIVSFIRQVYDLLQWPGVVVLMAIESACIPLPSELIMPLAGWMLIKEQDLGMVYILLSGFYGALGCTLGSTIAYWVGAWGGRPMAERYGRYVLISHRDLELADRWFKKYGDWVIFTSRLMPVIRTFISLPAGVARMKFPKFLIYTFAGSFPWCFGLTYGGYQLGEHWQQISTFMRPFWIPIMVAIAVLIGLYIYRHLKAAPSKE
jgi:membrane protein DedA with SNARE-associated domain